MDTNTDRADTAEQDESGWGPLDCLRSLGRAASIAAGAPGICQQQSEFHGFRIVVGGQHGAYTARLTHHHGKAIHLPASLRNQLDAVHFPSPEQAAQHARFLIISGALNPVMR